MPSHFRSLPVAGLVAVVVTALLVGIGVSRSTSTHDTTTSPLATRLASVDTTTLTVRRGAFCTRVGTSTAAAALRTRVVSRQTWQPGQQRPVGSGVTDVVDEYGCSWTTASGTAAQAWVFAPPVTPERAATLAKQVPTGCQRLPASTTVRPTTSPTTTATSSSSQSVAGAAPTLAFGASTSALTCGDATMLRGLFGDAWLTCTLPSQDFDLVGRWCLAVARAAA